MTTTHVNGATNKRLHEVFMEFKVKVRGKSLVKKAHQVVDNAMTTFKVSKDKFTSSKKILHSKELKNVQNTAQALRLFVKAHTVRLGDYDVINSKLYIENKQKVNTLVEQHEKAIREFLAAVDEIQKKDALPAPDGLGDLYNAADYPSEDELNKAFGVEIVVRPLPDFSRMQVNGLDDENAKSLLERLNGTVNNEVNQMQSDLLRKLVYGKNPDTNEGVGNGLMYAIQKIGAYEEKVNNFRQATIDNVVEIAEIVDNLNALGNEDISKFAEKIRKLFFVDADDLKDNKIQREKLVMSAEEELDKIESAMAGFM